jgi:hypothetical protein
MDTQATKVAVDSCEIVERLLHRMDREQLTRLIEVASASSGQVVGSVSFEPGDELCPTLIFPFPFPPRFGDFLSEVTTLGSSLRLFPYGILNPEGVLVQISGRIAG